MAVRPLNVGLIGLGTVGSQVAERMLSWGPQLSRRAGGELCLPKGLVRGVAKRRAIEISPHPLTADPPGILANPAREVREGGPRGGRPQRPLQAGDPGVDRV